MHVVQPGHRRTVAVPPSPTVQHGLAGSVANASGEHTEVAAGAAMSSGLTSLREALASHDASVSSGRLTVQSAIATRDLATADGGCPIDAEQFGGQELPSEGFTELVEGVLSLTASRVACLCLVGFGDPGLVAATAGGLARELVQRDRNVLLVDGDLAFGALSRQAGQQGRSGLVEILNQSGLWRRALYPTSCGALTFMPVGRGVLSGSLDELCRWGALLQNLRAKFDTVVVSGGVWNAGTPAVCEACDRTVPIVELGASSRMETERGIAELRRVGVTTAGCIVVD